MLRDARAGPRGEVGVGYLLAALAETGVAQEHDAVAAVESDLDEAADDLERALAVDEEGQRHVRSANFLRNSRGPSPISRSTRAMRGAAWPSP